MNTGLILSDNGYDFFAHCSRNQCGNKIADDETIQSFLNSVKCNVSKAGFDRDKQTIIFCKISDSTLKQLEYIMSELKKIYGKSDLKLDVAIYITESVITTELVQRLKVFSAHIRMNRENNTAENWGTILQALYESGVSFSLREKCSNRGNKKCACSLVTKRYSFAYDTYTFCPDGSVRLCDELGFISTELANVHTDKDITYELLVKREQLLRDYLVEENLLSDNLGGMHENVCSRFKVTRDGIYRDEELVKEI